MAIGRISGSVLKSNLTRNGVDLAFETNLLYLDVTNSRVGIGTSEPNTALHVVGNTTITGDLSVSGNVSFEIGSINSLNTGALIVDDNNITGTRSNEDIIVSAAGTGRIVLKNTLIANTLQSDDSTTIQINDSVNITGTLNTPTIQTNNISSLDSTAIQINDALNVSGTLTANSFYTNNIYSSDTNIIQVNNGLQLFQSLILSSGGFTKARLNYNNSSIIDASLSTNSILLPTGTTGERPTGVEGMIRYNSTLDIIEGYTLSRGWAPIGTEITTEDPAYIYIGEKTAISTTPGQIDSFYTSTYDSAWYLAVTRDEINEEVATAVYSLTHNGSGSFVSASRITKSGSNDPIDVSTEVSSGSVRLLGEGNTVINSVSFYRIGLGENSTATSSGNTSIIINNDVDSTTESLDSWSLSSYRGAKYFISVKNSTTGETSNIECLVTHDNSNAYVSTYGIVNSGNNDLLTLTADTDSTTVTLRGSAHAPDCKVVMHRILLSDSESSSTGTNVNIIGSTEVSSGATLIDTFQIEDYTGCHYIVVGYNANEGTGSIHEVTLVSDGTNSYVTGGPSVNTKNSNQLSFTTSCSSGIVSLFASSTSGSSTTINAYRVQILRDNGGSAANAVLKDNNQTITGQKTFTQEVILPSISSGDSSAVVINDSINVTGTLVASNITYPTSDGTANQVLVTNGSGQLSFISLSNFTGITFVGDDSSGSTINTAETFKITGTSNITTAVSGDTLTITGPNLTGYAQKTDTAITIVGDDSTGTAVTVGETFKIAGGSNITTAVSGDVLTINGSNPAQGITFIGDDSTGTAIADGGTLQIVGAGSVTTAISGNILTITGTSSIDSLNTGGLLIDDNKITGQRSNEDIEISTSGTGVITIDTSIIPTTDDTVDLGSLTKRFKTGYFGSGTVYIGDQTISSSKTGLIFSGRVNMPSSMLDENAKIISKIGIDTSEKTIDSFSVSETRSALYYQVYRDEVHDEVIASKISIVHDGLEGFMSESAVVGTGTFVSGEGHTSSASVIGDNLLYKITGDSAINSVQSYKISLRDNTGLRSIGRTSTLRYENLSTAETVIDTWDIDEYRSAKYFISVSDEGAQISNDYLNAEVCMVHDGTDAYVTTYNILSSSDESFITFTADVSDGVARLKAYSTSGTLNLKLHKLLLSDDESSDETIFQKIIGTVTASSSSTTIDSFHMTDTTAAFYTISAHDSNNTQSSVSEVIVVHDEYDPYIIIGPQLTTDGIIHLTFSVEILGNQVYLKAAGSEAEIKISGYKVSLHRPPAGNSNASLSAQGITIVGDDSTGTRISDNETVKITGGTGITTSMVGDTLTITATGSSESTAQGLTFVGDDSSGTRISDGETVKITGSGGITTAMSGDTLTITGPTAFTFNVAGDDSTQRAISAGNTIKFVGSNGISTTTDADGNVTISGTTLVTLNIDGGATATVYDLAGLNLDGGSGSSTYEAGETSVNGGGA